VTGFEAVCGRRSKCGAMTGGVGFVCGAGAGLAARRQERVAVCRRIGSVQMATGETDKGRKASGWQLGLAAFAGVVAGCFARPPLPSQAGIFGSSKMKLNESEKVSSGIATIGAGLGFVYLAYRRNRQEDNMESQKIRVRQGAKRTTASRVDF